MHIVANRVVKNATWIIGCRVAQTIIAFVISMFTARYLGPSNYGLMSYAQSVVTFVLPIMQLGLNAILVQEIVNHPREEGGILGTSLVLSFCSAILCMIGVILFALIANIGESITVIVCALYSLLLVCQSAELIQYWFQAKYLSKYTSITMLVVFVVIATYKVFLLVTQKGVYWFAVSNAMDYLLISITLLILYKKLDGQTLFFDRSTAVRLLANGKYYILSGLMVTIFVQTGRIMLKLMVGDAATGYYSAAATCAGVASFIFTAIIDSMRPLVLENKKISQLKFENSMIRLYSIVIYFGLLLSIGYTIFSSLIVHIFYGSAYNESIGVFRVLAWYLIFSYYGGAKDVWILAESKQKYLLLLNSSGAVCNVIMNLVLIPRMGAVGAAVATLITQFFTNIVMGFIIKPLKKNNILLIRSLNPKVLIDLINRKAEG